MAIIPNGQQFHTLSAGVDTTQRGSAQFNSERASFSMSDITASVINSGGGGGLAGTGTTGFIPKWNSPTSLGVSDIEKTLNYSTPNGGQYELRGNLKIFGEASGSGVAALFIEDSTSARIVIRDVVNGTSDVNSEFTIRANDTFTAIGTTVNSTADTILINALGQTKMAFRTVEVNGVDRYCFTNQGGAIGAPASIAPSYSWNEVFFDLDKYADEAAATAAGIEAPQLYQTDGTGAAPLNIAGIVMVKQ